MAVIVPFKGLRYNPQKIGNLASVVTPPYDVIDETSQARYYAENPANIIRLELGLQFPEDTENNNRYTRAAQYLKKWMDDEILCPDFNPTLYLYQQEFTVDQKKLVRTGFICGVKVEPYTQGSIRPHEQTLSKPKADRLRLMRATQCNFSSIFGLFADEGQYVTNLLLEQAKGKESDINIKDDSGEIHKIWIIDNAEVVDQVVKAMADKEIYIADGHHRYETALEYANEMREQGYEGYDYIMTTLVNLYDPGLVVLPTHRLIGNITTSKLNQLITNLSELFTIEEYDYQDLPDQLMAELESRGENQHVFGMYNGDRLFILTLKDMLQADRLLPQGRSEAWKDLDVALLDNLILDKMLGIGEQERRSQNHLFYTRSAAEVIEKINSKQYQLGFFLNPTRVEEIVDVARAGDKMPQKSTYFYPKLITGLVINNLKIR